MSTKETGHAMFCNRQYMKYGKESVQCTLCKLQSHHQCTLFAGIASYFSVNGESDMELYVSDSDNLKNLLLNLFQTFKFHYLYTFVFTFHDLIMCLNFFPYNNLYAFNIIIIDASCKSKQLRLIILISNIRIQDISVFL